MRASLGPVPTAKMPSWPVTLAERVRSPVKVGEKVYAASPSVRTELEDHLGQLRTVFPLGGVGGELALQLPQKLRNASPYGVEVTPRVQLLSSKNLYQLLFGRSMA